MWKKISTGDWAVILTGVGSGLGVLVGFIVWLTHMDYRIVDVTTAQADASKRDDILIIKIDGMNERLSRMEGLQKQVLSEVRNARE